MRPLNLREVIVALVLIVLVGTVYAQQVSANYRQAFEKAALRLIQERLDEGDVEAVKKALSEYNSPDHAQNSRVIIELLSH